MRDQKRKSKDRYVIAGLIGSVLGFFVLFGTAQWISLDKMKQSQIQEALVCLEPSKVVTFESKLVQELLTCMTLNEMLNHPELFLIPTFSLPFILFIRDQVKANF